MENGWFYSNCIGEEKENREQLFDYILENFLQIKTFSFAGLIQTE